MPKLVLFFSGNDMSGQYELVETNAKAEDVLRLVLDIQIEIMNDNTAYKSLTLFEKKFGYKVILSNEDTVGYPLYQLMKRPNILKVDTDYIGNSVDEVLGQ